MYHDIYQVGSVHKYVSWESSFQFKIFWFMIDQKFSIAYFLDNPITTTITPCALTHSNVFLFSMLLKKKTDLRLCFFRLTCIESALIISPPNLLANSIDNLVFPQPVDPKITINGTFLNIIHLFCTTTLPTKFNFYGYLN